MGSRLARKEDLKKQHNGGKRGNMKKTAIGT